MTPGPTNTSSPISIADAGSGFDKGMVAYVAIAPDDRSLHHMRKSPCASAGTNLFALAKRAGMNERRLGINQRLRHRLNQSGEDRRGHGQRPSAFTFSAELAGDEVSAVRGHNRRGVRFRQSPLPAASDDVIGGDAVAGGLAAERGAKGVRVSVPCMAVFSRSRPRDRCERTAPTEVPILCAASA